MEKIKNNVVIENLDISQFKLTTDLVKNLSQFEITPTAKLVLLYLSSCYNPKKAEMFPKQKTIAQKIGVSERSVVRAIQELFKEGLIIFECKYTNHYKFTSKVMLHSSKQLKNFTSDKLAENNGQNDQLGSVKMSPHEQIIQPNNRTTLSAEDYNILEKYAKSKNARNTTAYINFLIKNNLHNAILKEELKIKNNQKLRLEKTKSYLEQRKKDLSNVAPLPKEWYDFGKKLLLTN